MSMSTAEESNAEESRMALNVQSALPEGHPQGSFAVRVSPTASARQLLRLVCKQAKVSVLPSYGLETAGGHHISLNQHLNTLKSVRANDTLLWVITDDPNRTRTGCRCWNVYWFMGLLSLMICIAGLTTITYIHLQEEKNMQYAIVFDAGSSHTSMFIYKWEGEKINSTAVAIQEGPMCIAKGKGISSYASNSSGAGESLEGCLQGARGRIPTSKHSSTPVYLGATAGMRLLRKENPAASEAVMKSVRATISTFPFKFLQPEIQARILEGTEEGAFSWITGNYVTGTFNVHPPIDGVVPEIFVSSVGTLDLGGASTQITFIPNASENIQEENHFVSDLYGTNYSLYTHSYLCYGVNEAIRRLEATLVEAANYTTIVKNPCSPKGHVVNITHHNLFSSPCVSGEDAVLHYGRAILPSGHLAQDKTFSMQGESNATECRAVVTSSLFNLTTPCPHGCDHCSFNGICQPPVFGDFYGISSYYYVMQFLNLTVTESINYTNFSAATLDLCAKNWNEVKHMKAVTSQNLPWYCFLSIYIDTILVDGYGFDPNSTWDAIHFIDSIGGVDVGWSLGFTINESDYLPSTSVERIFTTVAFVLLICLFIGFFMLFLYFARLALGHRRFSKRSILEEYNGYGAI